MGSHWIVPQLTGAPSFHGVRMWLALLNGSHIPGEASAFRRQVPGGIKGFVGLPTPLPTPFYSQLGWCARVTLPTPALAPVMNTDTVISHTVT